VSLNGCIAQAPGFDTCGFLAGDAAMLLRIGDVLLPEDSPATAARLVVAEDCLAIVDDEVRERFACLFAALGIGETAQLFGDVAPDAVVAAYWTLMSRELWAGHGVWFERENPTLAPGVKERFIQASQVGAVEVQAAAAVRRRLSTALAALLADNKIVLFPTTHAVPLRRDAPFDAQMSYRAKALRLLSPASMGRLPQLVIPAVHVDDAHVGLSLIAGFARDRMLLHAALDLDEKVRAFA
jgi:amidase